MMESHQTKGRCFFMGVCRRAALYLARKKGKAFLLFLIFFLVGPDIKGSTDIRTQISGCLSCSIQNGKADQQKGR